MNAEEQITHWKDRALKAESKLAELTVVVERDQNRLTKAQRKVYGYLLQHVRENGFVPSIREIATGVNLQSSSTVHGHLDSLEKKGYIMRVGDKGNTRSIKLL